jgi:hypothetical protein
LAADLPLNPKSRGELEKLIGDFFAGKAMPTISPEDAVTEEGEE